MNQKKYKHIAIQPETHRRLIEYCRLNNLTTGRFVSSLLEKYLSGDFIDVAQKRNPNLFPETEEENIVV